MVLHGPLSLLRLDFPLLPVEQLVRNVVLLLLQILHCQLLSAGNIVLVFEGELFRVDILLLEGVDLLLQLLYGVDLRVHLLQRLVE